MVDQGAGATTTPGAPGGRRAPLGVKAQSGLVAVGTLAPLIWTLVVLPASSRLQFLALVGPSLLLAPLWTLGARWRWAVAASVLLMGWGWVAEAAYVNRYQASWPLSEFDPVAIDVPVFLLMAGALFAQRVARVRREGTYSAMVGESEPPGSPTSPTSPDLRERRVARVVAGVFLVVIGGAWWLLALGTAAFVETPPDDVAVVLGLPTDELVVATGPEGWSCSTVGEFCNATAGVAATDGADAGEVVSRLERHLRDRGWHHPSREGLQKGLILRVPLYVEIEQQTPTAVTVIVFWGTDPGAA